MGQGLIAPAKISRPRTRHALPRPRLFQVLDQARAQRATWIFAPPGAGKTTLASSYVEARKLGCLWYQIDQGDADPATFFHYLGIAAKLAAPRVKRELPHLTPEYLPALPLFTRRYFEQMCERLKPPCVLVFDNYQDVPADAALHSIMCDAIAALPEGIEAIFISRTDPPAAFARLRATGAVAVLNWDRIRLTPEESHAIARARAPDLSEAGIARLHEQTQGWAAGLILALDHESNAAADVTASPQGAFDYFATEVFERMAPAARQTLLQCALLPLVTNAQAAALTGDPRAAEVFDELSRRGYLTLRHAGGYQIHPLFRDFLLSRLQHDRDAESIAALRRRASGVLEAAGEIAEAMELAIDACAWDQASAIVKRHAPRLLQEGRTDTLGNWLRAMPEEWTRADPWLQYWLGACRSPFNYQEGHALFAQAFALFRERGDSLGIMLSWAGSVEAMMLDFGDLARTDPWIDEFDRLRDDAARFPSLEVELRVISVLVGVLTLRRPERLRDGPWVPRLHELLLLDLDIRARCAAATYLTTYYLWVGDYARSAEIAALLERLTKQANASALPRVIGKVIAAVHYARIADNERCRKAVAAGLDIANETGVHNRDSFLHSQAAVADIDDFRLTQAAAHLASMADALAPHRYVDWCMYRQYAGWHALLSGELARAEQHARHAFDDACRAGSPFHIALSQVGVALVSLLRAPGSLDQEAFEAALRSARSIGESMDSAIVLFMCRLLTAHAALTRALPGARERGLAELREAMAIGRRHGYVNTYWWTPSVMASLCAQALAHDIEPDYVIDLIRRRGLLPPPEAMELERWPWPLRIRTLGAFALLKDGVELRAGAQGQKRPIELLQAIIAFGGKDVSEAKLCDALWPDAEADQARSNFKVALHRLRKLIAVDAIEMREGRLSLDATRCRVDAWALERLIRTIGETLEPMSGTEALRAGERLFALYRGPFLADESTPVAIGARERLQSSLLRATAALAERCVRLGAHDGARALYERLLEIEPLAESAYLGLMKIFLSLRRPAEGLAAYERCRRNLRSLLQITPSPETEALAASLRALGA